MDRYLTFVDHVDHVIAKCNDNLIELVHARHSLPETSVKSIVNALAMSIVRYCTYVYLRYMHQDRNLQNSENHKF